MMKKVAEINDKRLIASEHFMKLPIMLDTATAPAGNVYPKGQVLGKITASGLYGPYDDTQADGRETATMILAHQVELELDSVGAALVTGGAAYAHGAVYEADLVGIDAAGKTDLDAHFIFV